MNFVRVVDVLEDEDEIWVEFENGSRLPLLLSDAPEELELGDLLYVADNEIRRAPKSAIWKSSLQTIGRLVSVEGNRAIMRIDRSARVEEVDNIQAPQIDRYYFFDNDTRKWLLLSDTEASAAEGAEAIEFSVNRFEVEHLLRTAGGKSRYGGMTEWFDKLLAAVVGNFNARAGESQEYNSGAILFGPPGTGKTYLARSIAEEAEASLFTVNGPELVDRWFGSTERAMRDLFETARQHPRAVIFIDEFDSIGPRRGPDVHEAINRQVGQLLSLTDSATRMDRPFVIAATNRLEDVDPGFLRSGRFDYKVPFELPLREERHEVIRAQAKDLDGDVAAWIAGATDGWSPAQLAQIWREANHRRSKHGRSALDFEDVMVGLETVRTEHATLSRARDEWLREREN